MYVYADLRSKDQTSIDYILTPVFQTIRKNKINSFRQLKDLHNKSSLEYSYIFQTPKYSLEKTSYSPNKTQSFSPVMEKYTLISPKTAQNKYSSDTEQNNNFITFLINKQKYNPVKSNHDNEDLNQRTKKISINQQKAKQNRNRIINMTQKFSKIKKHLVDKIDFNHNQRKLFKQRQYKTRYEHFMESKSLKMKEIIKKPNKKQQFDITISSFNKNISFINDQNNIIRQHMVISSNRTQIISQKNYGTGIHRKKFWLKPSVVSNNKNIANRQSKGPLNLLQGKAYKTITE